MKKSYLILVVVSVILITAPSVDANFLTSFFQNFVKPGLKIGLGLFKKIFPEGAALTDSVANIFHLGDDPEQQGIKKDTMKRIGTGVREMISKHSSGATNDGSVNVHLLLNHQFQRVSHCGNVVIICTQKHGFCR